MPVEGTPSTDTPFLAADEPAPFVVLCPQSQSPVLLVCDHASRRIPRALGTMGLDPVARRCHLAWDIGAGPLTERLSAALCVTAVCAQYSRLVVDCNRQLLDPSAFLEYGDGVVVHGNRSLSQQEKDKRADILYWPYHQAVDAEISRLSSLGHAPTVVAVHSFTPVLNGLSRPWEVGVLWDADRPTAELFLAGFAAAGLVAGDNEPYSGMAPADFTIDHHAEASGLAHVGIEIRQDLIDDDAGVATFTKIMYDIIRRIAPVGPSSANDEISRTAEDNTSSNL